MDRLVWKKLLSRIGKGLEVLVFIALAGWINFGARNIRGPVIPLQIAIPYRAWINVYLIVQIVYLLVKMKRSNWNLALVVANVGLNIFFTVLLYLVIGAIWFPTTLTKPFLIVLTLIAAYDSGESIYQFIKEREGRA